MIKPSTWLLVFLFAASCLVATVVMPWAELGMHSLPGFVAVKHLVSSLPGAKDPGTCDYYVYSLFLGVALISAAIAINAIGRLEAEEKTVLPVKK